MGHGGGRVSGAVRLAVATASAVTVGVLPAMSAPGAAAAPNHRAPADPHPVLAYPGDFPDPFVLVAGGVTYAYSTNVAGVNVPVMTSTDLSTWTPTTEALPRLPAWASPGRTWAPTVMPKGPGYVMYYTVTQTSTQRQCVSVATAAVPTGPFRDSSSGPLVCQLLLGGSIDPYVFRAPSGSWYLLWKSDDNALGRRTSLWGRALASTGVGFAPGSSAVRLLSQTAAWQAPAMEGPAMVRSGGTYCLFYGAGSWSSASAAIGYATCSGPLGPCTDRSRSQPWFATAASGAPPVGPQGPTVFTALDGSTRLGFAAWNGVVGYANGGVRAFWIDGLTFPNGVPTLS